MKTTQIYMLAIAASFLGGSISHADEVGQRAEGRKNQAVYEGLDDRGRVVRLTISDLHVETFERITALSVAGHSEPHWSSLFGTGAAAEAERHK